jgi:hypothetical protein
MANSPQIIEINELDPEIIPPLTDKISDPNYSGGSKIVVIGKPGCFAKGTEILMADFSIKKVEDVQIGDKIMGDDSTTRIVVELCRERELMYEIVPQHGQSYTVNENHFLVLEHPNGDIIEMKVKEYVQKAPNWSRVVSIYKNVTEFPFTNERTTEECKTENTIPEPYLFGMYIASLCSGRDPTKYLKHFLDFCQEIKYRPDSLFNERRESFKTMKEFTESHSISMTNIYIPSCYKSGSLSDRTRIISALYRVLGKYNYETSRHMINLTDMSALSKDVVFILHTLGCFTETIKDDSGFAIDIAGPIHLIKDCDEMNESKLKANTHVKSSFKVVKKRRDDYYGFTITGNHRFLLATGDVVRNTGKSSLIKGLLYAKKHVFPVGMAMSGSEDVNHTFKKIMPDTFVYNDYNEDKIKDFIRRQKLAHQHLPNPWAFIVIDDCTDDPRIFNKPLQNNMYKKGRHYKCMYILSLQYAMDVPPQIRTNIDGTFILREPLESVREKLYRNFASIIPTYDLFCTLMDQLTEDYHAIYIHNATRSNKWQDCVFYWRAKLPPKDWEAGCPEYWDFHKQRYNLDYVDPVMDI